MKITSEEKRQEVKKFLEVLRLSLEGDLFRQNRLWLQRDEKSSNDYKSGYWNGFYACLDSLEETAESVVNYGIDIVECWEQGGDKEMVNELIDECLDENGEWKEGRSPYDKYNPEIEEAWKKGTEVEGW